jgi:hypothetical protein
MLDILSITGPIYIAVILGYLSTRLGLFSTADMRVLGRFVIYIPLPAMLFNALAQRPISEVLNVHYLLIYGGGSALAMVLALGWVRRGARQDLTRSVYYAIGMSCSNSGFVGYPIALLTVGTVAGVMLGLNMMVENLFLVPFLLALAEAGQAGADRWYRTLGQTLLRLLRNPLVLGLLTGLAFSLMAWRLPAALARTVDLLAQVSAPVSLFVIGGSLVGLQVRGLYRPVAQITAGKLLLHPLCVLLVMWLAEELGLPPLAAELRIGAVLFAACPVMSVYPILAQRHGQEGVASAAMLTTTMASFVTISGLLWLLKQFPGWSV